MPDFFVVLFAIILSVLTLTWFLIILADEQFDWPFSLKVFMSILLPILCAFLWTWIGVAEETTPKVVLEKVYKIEEIKFPDGIKKQIILTEDHREVNITNMFSKIYPENTLIKETTYSEYNYGIYLSRCFQYKYEVVSSEKLEK
jgi:hypothetical protein